MKATSGLPAAAERAGMSVDTLTTHLRRAPLGHPELWERLWEVRLWEVRRRQLAARHETALARAARHSAAWHRAMSFREHTARPG